MDLALIPAAAWGAIGILGAALIGTVGAFIGNWFSNRNKEKVDAGQLALEYATALRLDVDQLKNRVATLEQERNAYRSHAHTLHEWGGYVETADRPRPMWPVDLAR